MVSFPDHSSHVSYMYLLCVEFVEVFVEQFSYVLHHGGTCDLYDAGGLWRVCIVESVFYQAALTPIQVLDFLFTYHDFLRRKVRGGAWREEKIGKRKRRKKNAERRKGEEEGGGRRRCT